MPMATNLHYTALSPRATRAIQGLTTSHVPQDRLEAFANISPRPSDSDGHIELLDDVAFTHRFGSSQADYESIEWHYVTCGDPSNTPIVFLHGIPDSWFQWHHQMASLSGTHFCVGVDLKGYGQSSKAPGAYTHEACAEQLFDFLQTADFICAKHPTHVIGYARGEQHLYHFHPALAPQHEIFMNAPYSGVMHDPTGFVLSVYQWIAQKHIPDEEMKRVIQEFSYPDIARAVPRYFMSSTFRQEWLARRRGGWRLANGSLSERGLLEPWTCPIIVLQGKDSKTQPREFYEDVGEHVPNAKAVEIRFLSGGHFWTLESPQETVEALERMIELGEA